MQNKKTTGVARAWRRIGCGYALPAGIVLLLLAAFAAAQSLAPADPVRYIHDIQSLTTPQMEGRGNGSHGLTLAQKILVARYRSLGLEPKGTHGFLQPFTVVTGAELTPANHLTVESDGAKKALVLQSDWVPFSFSSSASVKAALVFAGYGISAEERKYDDYVGLDVKGKIAVVLRGEPASFSKGNAASPHAQLVTKAINARNHGAVALLLLNGKMGHGEEDLLTRFGSASGPEDVGLPFAQVKNVAADSWFAAAGTTLAAAQRRSTSGNTPHRLPFPPASQASVETGI